MEISTLVISIVLENDDAFHDLSAKEIAFFMASCKDARESKVLQKMQNKHRALHLYYTALNTIQDAAYVLKKYRTIQDLDLSRKLFADAKEFVRTFDNELEPVKECLSRILIAEYKELLFELAYHYIQESYYDFAFLFRIFKSNIFEQLSFITPSDIQNGLHDPTHYAFLDLENGYYKFYEKIEVNGINVFQDDKCKKYVDMIEGRYDSDEDESDYDEDDE